MKMSVIGCGYLGAVHAAAMASLGHEVIGIDVDQAKIDALAAGISPIYEPGLPELLTQAHESGALSFSTDIADAADATVHFVAVGTPQSSENGSADLRFVDAAIDSLIPILSPGDLVVGKSTVPVGTAQALQERIAPTGAELAWNPEFLREGFAVKDTIEPDRLVYGVVSDRAVEILDAVYARAIGTNTPRIVTDYATAELVKTAANAFLATKISFINAMAEIAEATGADVTQLADAIGHDNRIGRRFLNAGAGFGGGCLPKDIRAFSARATELGRGDSVAFLAEVDAINLRRRARVSQLVIDSFGGDIAGRRVAVLGLAFKPDSDDVRDSPALDIARHLAESGATAVCYDPQAIEPSRRVAPELTYVESANDALSGAEAVVIATEWSEFKALTPDDAGALVSGRIIVDARNILSPGAWRDAGWTYHGLGRP